ncbi:branched-chain amino acid ABC transporter substrate-binding protein [Defluviimonas sp. 20V17]|uniref:Amino acid/amide ABC transporter substrate-binding protein, HAAT family n=2 Tax=Allgaiera indica TaxID=765699 RepID=A0A1H3C5M6_9RHOB|nr:ABC transporter substrate-binding protein [Allgaiera indica]KDB05391.1 branched-chain amino acid ABC transporter substrate-binding protein [Defluviimonas sp. 20V17]SDX49375.1 amino acid/amide ABC transporter substrate-binding protein, HAAT family [Allgaiera indica]
MKKLLLASAAMALCASGAMAKEVKIGIVLGFTGPLESTAPPMADAAKMAIAEVDKSGEFFNGEKIVGVKGDSTCIDSTAAVATAERLVTADHISGIMGAMCSGATGSILQNVARPNGVVMISPSATSPALSTAPDDGLFFRTAPSDARQGQIIAKVLLGDGIKTAALTYTNNDYGKGLADSFKKAYEAAGGKVTISVPHEDGKADYSAEVGSLAAAGGDILVDAGYADQGGKGIVQAALDTGAFNKFYFPDGMYGPTLPKAFGKALDKSIGDVPGTDSPGAKDFFDMAKKAGFDGTSSFAAESYDAAALIMLAMQAAKSTDSNVYKTKVMDVANAPGVKIYPGQLGKAMKLLKEGKDIDYVGASAVELVGPGEAQGNYRIYGFKNGKRYTIKYM